MHADPLTRRVRFSHSALLSDLYRIQTVGGLSEVHLLQELLLTAVLRRVCKAFNNVHLDRTKKF